MKLAAIDLDGTLLDRNGKIPKKTSRHFKTLIDMVGSSRLRLVEIASLLKMYLKNLGSAAI